MAVKLLFNKNFLVVLALAFLLFSNVYAKEDTIFTIRSSQFKDDFYLLGEDIVFGVDVSDVNDVTFYTKCLDDSDTKYTINTNLTTYRMSDNIFLTKLREVNATCQDLELAAKYIKNDEIVTLTKIIHIVYFNPIPRYILDNQLESGSWNDNSLSTAYAIYALTMYEDSYSRQIDKGMNWLKENRGDDEKCWPADDCRIDTTAKIHGLLWLSDYDDKYRIMHNSRLWLLDKQNILPDGATWKLNLTAYQNFTECVYNDSYDEKNETILSAITLNSTNYHVEKVFTPVQGEHYDVVCTRDIELQLYNHLDNLSYNATTDNLTYQVPNKCWDDDMKWNLCDVETTEFALLSNIPSDRRKDALDWLDKITKSSPFGEYIDDPDETKKVIITSLYLFNKPNNPDVIDWLLYHQNNDGSWGGVDETFEDKLEVTVYAILALEKSGYTDEDETILDAKKWIYTQVPYGDWDTIKKAALAHVALSSFSKKYLRVNPSIIEVGASPVNVELYNPTPYYFDSLSFSLTNNLAKYLDFNEIDTIPSGIYKVLNLKAKDGIKVGDYYGYLIIKNKNNILNEIPILVGKKPLLKFSYSNKSVIFGTKGALKLNADIDDATYDCHIHWANSELLGDSDFQLTKKNPTATIKFALHQSVPELKQYLGEVSCDVNNKKVFSTIDVFIKQYSGEPFSLSTSLISIDNRGENAYFNITNKIDEPLKMEIKFKTPEVFFEFDNDKFTLNPGETKTVKIMNLLSDDANVSTSNVILVSNNDGITKRITFSSDILTENKKKFNIILLVIIVIILIFLYFATVGIFFIVRKNLYDSADDKKKKSLELIDKILIGSVNVLLPKKSKLKYLKDIKTEEKEIQNAVQQKAVPQVDENVDYHIADMIDIMRSLNKPEAIIRKELEQEGFTLDQIDKGLKEADRLAEEREKAKKKKSGGAKGQVGQ